MSDDDEPTWESLTETSPVECSTCGKRIVYDPRTSWWMDDSGVPGCAPLPDGSVGEHVPRDTEEFLEAQRKWVAEQRDPLDRYKDWPTE